ncbi:MAG TPA: 2,3-bisphosphoglycerate-dependent phosphoglycerate mutase, partial [Kofleriaceae bacterium]|nr:2,3-bisphosphoglycerate-dependent phosphoglycerate mutase [Kofleriaceae bacterium]
LVLALLVSLAPARPVEAKGKARPRLVIMRHGESTANQKGRFAGSRNVRLTRKGRSQAERAGRALRGIRFDRAYSSSLGRAATTLRLALEAAGQPKAPRARTRALDERSYGLLEGQRHADAASRYGAERLRRWRLSWNDGPPGGESLADVSGRAVPFLDRQVMADLAAGKNVLVASHKHTIRALVGHLEGLSPAELEKLDISNAEPIVYRLGRDGKLRRERPRRRR